MANKPIRNRIIFFIACHYPELVTGGRHFLILFCFILFSVAEARPQSPENREAVMATDIKPLSIGDQIPDELWNLHLQLINHTDGKETITLSEYKDKLIILDFWATWCSSCIKELPRLDGLQTEFNGDVKFIAIGNEPKLKIRSAITKFKINAPNLSFVHSDTVLNQVFPHRFVPHDVWIKKGKVVAITSASKVDIANINQLLNSGTINVETKKDLMEFDDKKSLTENVSALELTPIYNYQSLLTEKIEGAGRNSNISSEDENPRLSFINYPLRELYRVALGIPMTGKNTIIWKLNSQSGLFPDGDTKTYCYEIRSLSPTSISSLKKVMLNDLNRHFKFRVATERRNEKDYYVISNQ